MNRGQLVKGYGGNICILTATYVGAGAANPTVATNAQHNKGSNAAASGTRAPTGIYTLVLNADAACPRMLHVIPTVEGSNKRAVVTTSYVASTRTVVVSVFDGATDAAADLASGTDFLKLTLITQDTSS